MDSEGLACGVRDTMNERIKRTKFEGHQIICTNLPHYLTGPGVDSSFLLGYINSPQTKAQTMRALPPNHRVSPSQLSAILFTEMFDRDYGVAGVMGSTAGFEELPARLNTTQNTLLLSPNKAFGKRAKRSGASLRSTARKSKPRSVQTNVLVVDDVSDVTEMIALFLKHAGYEVATADSASAALRLAEEQNFDLIISDIGMPEMNGYELAGALRRLSEYQSIPMIAVTGYTEYDDRGRALQAGFTAHLTKPIDPTQLLHLMNTLLG